MKNKEKIKADLFAAKILKKRHGGLSENAFMRTVTYHQNYNELVNCEYIIEILDFRKERGMIVFLCRTSRERKVHIFMEIWADNIVRLYSRFSPTGEGERDYGLIQVAHPQNYYKLKETRDKIAISTKSICIEVGKKLWQLAIKDMSGNLVCSRAIDDRDPAGGFNSYPFCLGHNPQTGKQSVSECFRLGIDESFYGFGERFEDINKKGKKLVLWSQAGWGTLPPVSYKPIPFFISSNGYGMFVHTTYPVTFDLGESSYQSFSFQYAGPFLDYFIIYGPTPKQILEGYIKITGRPVVPPKWAFGYWQSSAYFNYYDKKSKDKYCGYFSERDVKRVSNRLRKDNFPCDVILCDCGWSGGMVKEKKIWDYWFNPDYFKDPEKMLKDLAEKGFKLCVWVWPYICKTFSCYKELSLIGYLVKDKKSNPICDCDGHYFVDFTNPRAVEWFQNKIRRIIDAGVMAIKTDFGEYIPEEAVFYNGKTGLEMHNLYLVLYQKAVFDVLQEDKRAEKVLFARGGYAGSQRMPIHWAGDNLSRFEDLAYVVKSGLNIGVSGIPFWSHDVGGICGDFHDIIKGIEMSRPSGALFIRWFQVGVFSPIIRTHCATKVEPWTYGEKTYQILKRYIRLRYKLIPYIYNYAVEAGKNGCPIIRPLFLEYPDDLSVRNIDSEYMFGKYILVAPMYACNKRMIYLPKGIWLDYWNNKEYRGGCYIEYRADLSKLPLFLREDSVVPMGNVRNFIRKESEYYLELDIFIKKKVNLILHDENRRIHIRGEREKNGIRLSITNSTKRYYKLVFRKVDKVLSVNVKGTVYGRKNIGRHMKIASIWKMSKDVLTVRFNSRKKDIICILKMKDNWNRGQDL